MQGCVAGWGPAAPEGLTFDREEQGRANSERSSSEMVCRGEVCDEQMTQTREEAPEGKLRPGLVSVKSKTNTDPSTALSFCVCWCRRAAGP